MTKYKYYDRYLCKMNEFDPNSRPREFRSATYAPSRTPEFKVHRNIGHAKNAMYRDYIIRYEWDDDTEQWVEIERKP